MRHFQEIEVALDIFHQHKHYFAQISGRKKSLLSLDPGQFDNRSKKGPRRLVQGNVLQKTFIKSSQVTNHESVHMNPKQNNNRPCGSSTTSQIQKKSKNSKQIVASFFGITGHVATVPLEQRRMINSEWYTTICLPEVFREIRKMNKRRRIILHNDNASSHTSA
uniref:Uncharacterized protein n=1 Tax=Anopheles funestus TaxID=62324 RepID=A0A182RUD9_ANOFN